MVTGFTTHAHKSPKLQSFKLNCVPINKLTSPSVSQHSSFNYLHTRNPLRQLAMVTGLLVTGYWTVVGALYSSINKRVREECFDQLCNNFLINSYSVQFPIRMS
jgi:hypothetical protein